MVLIVMSKKKKKSANVAKPTIKEETINVSTPLGGVEKFFRILVIAYTAYIGFVVLYTRPENFYFDTEKQILFYIGTVCFLGVFLVSWILYKVRKEKNTTRKSYESKWLEKSRDKFTAMDLFPILILIVWLISFAMCQSKQYGFWGDPYRVEGLAFFGLDILAMWALSFIVRWNVILSWVFVVVSAVTYTFQFALSLGVDITRVTNDIAWATMGSLGNVDQNACVDVLFIAISIGFLLNAKTKFTKVVFSALIFYGFLGGLSTEVSSFIVGLFILFIVLFGVALRYTTFFKRTWLVYALLFVSMIVFRLVQAGYMKSIEGKTDVIYAGISDLFSLMTSAKGIIAYLVVLAVLALIGYKFLDNIEAKAKLISRIWFIAWAVVAVAVFIILVAATSAYSTGSQGAFLGLVNTYSSERVPVWSIFMRSMGMVPGQYKVFGVGLGHATITGVYMPEELEALYGTSAVLADAHNAYVDLLFTTGVIGFFAYFAFLVFMLRKSIKKLKDSKVAVFGVLVLAGYFGISVFNSNFNVEFMVFAVAIGVVWAFLRRTEKDGYEIETDLVVVKGNNEEQG